MLDKDLEVIKSYIKDEVEELLPDNSLSEFVLNGSKYVRSKLALHYIGSQCINFTDNLYKVLAAGELIHNASLLHDDVIDSAVKRRGKTTIGELYSSNISILSGDYLVSKAVNILNSIGNIAIINIFNKAIKNMTKAEIKQYINRNNIIKNEEYIEICKGKTASLFSAILESSAEIANLSRDKARIFGELFGIAFQIKNDLNYESIENDKKNGICTIVNILGVENAHVLLDNYKEEMLKIADSFSDSNYKNGLKDLIKGL